MKFKNIKKKVYRKKSPSNSRSITEHFKFSFPKINHIALIRFYHEALRVFVVLIFTVAVVIVGFDFKNNLQMNKEIDSQRAVLVKELNFWENFISKSQNYPDAYFQVSILEYRLGNMSKAKSYTEKGLVLDPNSVNGRKIEEFLKNKLF